MTYLWQFPIVDPVIGQLYCDALEAGDHDKAFAFPTPFRYSSVYGCARAHGYGVAEVPESDPMDGASLAIVGMGTLLHEAIQVAVASSSPDARFEVESRIGDLISGHVDIDIPSRDEVVEVKTLGSYKFDQAIGVMRKGYKRTDPKGPDIAHVVQAGMNARGLGRSTVRILYVSREAVSVALAAKVGLSSIDRFCAEWVLSEEVWGPLVDDELARLALIRETVGDGFLPERSAWDDKSESWRDPDPDGSRPAWNCLYCRYAQRCRMDGPGEVPVPVEMGATR